MVDILQSIFYLFSIGVMILLGNMLWHVRKLTKRQLEQVELQINKTKPQIKE